MASKNNKKTRHARIVEAQRIERELMQKKEEKRIKAMAKHAEDGGGAHMAVDGGDDDGGGARGTSGAKGLLRVKAKNVRVAASLRASGGVGKKREGKNKHKVVKGVKTGGLKLKKNSVVKGIKIVDATTKAMALEAIMESTGQGHGSMRD